MPPFTPMTRYYIEVVTTVRVRTHDGNDVATFTVHKTGTADRNRDPLEVAINNAAEATLAPITYYATAVEQSEKERLSE